VASSEAVFGLTEAQRGLVPGGGSMVRLCRQIPWARAMEILLLGETITADEALDIGLINAVVAPDRVMAAAHDYADRLAANGPLAVQKIKEAAWRTSGLPIDEAHAIENDLAAEVMMSKDAREGPRAFMEKRPPNFTGT
jgi:enoyl-CoA hydratase